MRKKICTQIKHAMKSNEYEKQSDKFMQNVM